MTMTMRIISLAALLACLIAGPAMAHPHTNESGHGRHHAKHAPRKEVYWDGHCKVERHWKGNGDYREKRTCKNQRDQGPHYHRGERQVVINLPPWLGYDSTEPRYRSGREPKPRAHARDMIQCGNSQVGQVLGGILGGILGNQMGGGSGKTAATIGGTIAGVFIGGELGRHMGVKDQACVAQVLEFAPPEQRIAWQYPNSRHHYAVIPGPIEIRGDSYCRSFVTELQRGPRPLRSSGMACRQPDGVWR